MMRADFAVVVDPIFELTLQSVAQLDQGIAIEPETLRLSFLQLFDRADALQGARPQWRLAKYALASWIDELLLNTPWNGAQWWRDHILEMEFFQSRECSIRFFELAEQASAQRDRDALEVYVNCVQLGFRGALAGTGQSSGQPLVSANKQVCSVEQWLQRMAACLEVAQVSDHEIQPQHPQRLIEGAPPLVARQSIVWWSLAAAVLLLMNGWAWRDWAFHWLSGR